MASLEKDSKSIHLDEVLMKFPIFARYQVFNLLLVSLAFMTNAIYSTNYVFAAADVDYRCKYKDCENYNVIYQIQNTSSNIRCFYYPYKADISDGNETCSKQSFDFTKTIPCDKWTYEVPHSFVSEFQLACQNWKRTLIGTIHSFGYMVGLLIVGPLSDKLGRKKSIVVTGVIGGIIGLSKSFTNLYWMYVFLEFIEAAIGDTCSPVFTLNVETVPKERLVLYHMIASFAFTIGGILLAAAAWYFTYWRHLLRVIYAPALLFGFYALLLDESPRWLLSKGKKDKAVAILDRAASISKVDLSQDDLNSLCYENNDKKIKTWSLLKNTFESKVLLKRFLICITWWTTCTFTNYGLTINSVSLKGNKYINYALMSLVDIPVNISGIFILNRYKRKIPLMFSFLLGGVICVIQPLVSDISWLTIVLYLIGKCMASFSFVTVYIFTSELFPTYTRNSMHALCSSLGRVGSIIAPQTPLLMRYWPGLPALLFGLASLVAGVLTIFVPDTADAALPDNVKQAEIIRKHSKKITSTI